ncbi:MAG: ketopantoate reductase family protein [Burkholderiaceae bacterium]
MKILVLGAGGVGGYFGGRLAQSGADVSFLVREKRKQQLDAHGLLIESHFGDATVPVATHLRADIRPDYDLVLLTCKAYDLSDAMDTIEGALGDSTVILPLLNGVAHLELLNQRFGASRVWGGTAKIAATVRPDGVIRHLNEWHILTFGAQDKIASSKIKEFKALLDKAGVTAVVSPDITRDLWMKLVHLGTIATLTSLMRANAGEINRTPDGKALFQRVLETNIQIASREGYPPDPSFIASYRELFSQSDSIYEASLARDIEKGGPIESDHILGFLLERCRAHGLPDDIPCLAYTHAKAYEQRRAANRLPARAAA